MNLSDSALVEKTKALIKIERETTTEILRNLREIEKRKLYSDYRCSSLFDFCMKVLGYSEGSAQRRIQAMRLIRGLPEAEAKIASGELSLSVAAQAQSFFRQEPMNENRKREVLEQLHGKSTREAEKKLLSLSSNPEIHQFEKLTVPVGTTVALEKLKGLLAHAYPNLSPGEIVAKLVEAELKKRDPAREPARKLISPPAPAAGRTPTASLKRVIFQRDHGQCTNCSSTYMLEIDHIQPWSRGGPTTLENLRLLCRNCNQRRAYEFNAKSGINTRLESR